MNKKNAISFIRRLGFVHAAVLVEPVMSNYSQLIITARERLRDTED